MINPSEYQQAKYLEYKQNIVQSFITHLENQNLTDKATKDVIVDLTNLNKEYKLKYDSLFTKIMEIKPN